MMNKAITSRKSQQASTAPTVPCIRQFRCRCDNRTTDTLAAVRNVLQSPGQPLDPFVRSFMEPRFGRNGRRFPAPAPTVASATHLTIGAPDSAWERDAEAQATRVVEMADGVTGELQDFSHIRIHTDAQAARSAQAINALAYTVGPHIVFGAGQYGPATTAGRHLLAHELAHTVQAPAGGGIVQRMQPCPPTLIGPTPPGWQSYHGDASVFHCGFRGILEDRRPTRSDPQNECFYDQAGRLVDETHPFAGCRGTPNQYDSSANPILHALIDSGGIVRAGAPAFVESRAHDISSFFGRAESEIRKLYGVP